MCMKQKIPAFLLAFILILVLNSCGGTPKTTVTTEEDTSKTVQTSSGTGDDGAVVASTTSQADTNPASKSAGTVSNPKGASSEASVPVGKPTVIDDSERADKATLNQFYFVGQWQHTNEDDAYNGTGSWVWQLGASYEIIFEGVKFEIYDGFGDIAGISYIYIDDELIAELDQYAPMNSGKNVLVYISPMLTPGKHTIKVVNSGTQNENCKANQQGRCCTGVDRVIVYAAA